MKIAIIGCGAMGSVYAALLADAGNEVWAIDTWQEHIDAIKKNGITKLIVPIVANQIQSFEKASILIFLYKHRITTGMAPNKILKKAIVIGP